ncbi:arginine--tRNA ligase [Blochmannia endosymbiont of Polyrhachis (Hedomyrma) turneri]|uniref:arginine--tRNA ligase n=1 Tax=Blochmannia endosymbiont of Polyrhachis (Hedomyrma) turneri TaxID=1505596 RepID=UPI00061A7F8B|nr:arginine--tRNA ligase [Blochmannia endosymbiont of Polyrhachis (Hedomyrma) turneri]AKC60019.1 arginine-tRNA ligase [Blochmannia endosymbiont of Polyrhachis (Hedomyrma) turneri]
MNLRKILLKKINIAFKKSGIPNIYQANVQQSSKIQFGDYQINGIISIAKMLNVSSKTLAKKIANILQSDNIIKKIEIAEKEFINIFLEPTWVATQVQNTLVSPRLGISPIKPKTIVIDYSAPNVAKEMHVGHLRSTIIGDVSVRTLSFLGHKIIRANHIGDWGTQFGMILAYLNKLQLTNTFNENILLNKIEYYYQQAKKKYDTDPEFAEESRQYVVKLQNGDHFCRNIWLKLVNASMKHNQKIYNQLNVTLKPTDIMGESLYNNMLPYIVEDLKYKKLAIEHNGAIVVFLDEFNNRHGQPMGVIIQKKDGGYLYTTTDIACIKYRFEILKAHKIIYYVDSRQHQHLVQVWTIARKANYIPKTVSLEHHMFGMILNQHGQPFKSRSGKTLKIEDLLHEAFQRAKNLIIKKNPNIPPQALQKLANIISIGAIKYADLSKHRTTHYVFDWNKILNFEGNTAPYIQYAYTRIISIFNQSKLDIKKIKSNIELNTKEETLLAVCLLQFEETILVVANHGTPHILCNYLYRIALLFSSFYENCSILQTKNTLTTHSRLQLLLLTQRTLKQGLNLLGISTTKYM